MKIALLNTYRVIQGRGGAEKVFCELANGFAQCGHEVLALAYDEAEGRPFYPLDSRVIFMNTWSGRNVLLSVVEKVKTFSFSKEIRRDRRRKLQQRKLFIDRTEKVVLAIREFSPDVILSFQISSSGYIKDGVGDIPVVTMLHGHPDFYEIEEEQKDILRKSRRVQSCCLSMRLYLKRNSPKILRKLSASIIQFLFIRSYQMEWVRKFCI